MDQLPQTTYRAIQEGVTNALRHANAPAIDVNASLRDGSVTIEVSDDGIGFTEVKFGRGPTGCMNGCLLWGTFKVLREPAGASVVVGWPSRIG